GSAPGRSQADPALSGGSDTRAAGERGGKILSPGRSQADPAPSGGSDTRAAGERGGKIFYGDVYLQNEQEQSAYNFEHADADFLFSAFAAHERQAQHLMRSQLALPAYEQVLKCAHSFNLLDARGAISVTERAAYIGRIRNLARSVAQSYYESRERLGFPMAPPEWVAQMPTKQAA
ncbi:MAG: glycine--tRNA ligase subunit alpha, partial [Serpentinimonas sp.]|nr:glycine--tRNA ligase subunit alpha [Serpentinimonas sp.]